MLEHVNDLRSSMLLKRPTIGPHYTLLSWKSFIIAIVLMLLIATSGPLIVAGADDSPTEEMNIILDEDGETTLTVTFTYDLTSDAEDNAYQEMVNDEEARQNLKDRFFDRVSIIAAMTSDRVDRDVTVTGIDVDFGTNEDDKIGVIQFSARFENLAETSGGTVTLSEPFASGFETTHEFTVTGPDGFELTSVTPSPVQMSDTQATWSAGSDLTGFEINFEQTNAGNDLPTTWIIIGVLGVGAAAALFVSKRITS